MSATAYVTMVQIPAWMAHAGVEAGDSLAAVSLASMALDGVADSALAERLRTGDVPGFFAGLSELLGDDGAAAPVSLEALDVSPDALGQPGTLQRLVGCALRSGTAGEARDYWNSGVWPDQFEQQSVDLILHADVLAEHSKAKPETFDQTAVKVAGGVGAGVMTAGVAVINAAGVTGVVVAIAGSGGIALLGIGAVYVTYRLLTRGRRQAA